MDALRAICNAFLPPMATGEDTDGYYARKAGDLKIAEYIVEAFGELPPEQQKEMRQLLSLLNSRMLGLTWGGPRKRAVELSLRERGTTFAIMVA